MKAYIFYTLYGIMVSALLLYYLFPSETAARYTALKVSEADQDINLHIDRVKPGFPPGLALSTVSVYYKNLWVADMERLNVIPSWMSLLKDRKEVWFKADTSGGNIKARVIGAYPVDMQEIDFGAELQHIRLEQIKAVEKLPIKSLRGGLNGKVAWRVSSGEEAGDAVLKLTDVRIEPNVPLIKLELNFSSIDTDIALRYRRIEIKQCLAKGEQFDGNISGYITLNEPLGESRLELSGNIRLHPGFAESAGSTLMSLVFKRRVGSAVYPFRISGTVDNYVFSWI